MGDYKEKRPRAMVFYMNYHWSPKDQRNDDVQVIMIEYSKLMATLVHLRMLCGSQPQTRGNYGY